MRQAKENEVFRILLAIGIILVVAGHADFHVFDFGGLFPYYSFHVAIFLFVSGYFYNEDDEAHIGKYIKRKALHLLVPYFLWNMFYGFVAFVLRFFGFFIGGDAHSLVCYRRSCLGIL
ncbi:acyltransferase family protein [Kineothrix sp. MB12-C1]|uniref:acyltransferase family protein n=1 Tax=Kineothrix sp. MB12-C1 TaxID=3070215 RepID=UPI0027D2D929|nr:acyltransferase family protein [Kineothrix sp. MB12-C1]WMC91822.1 acyltransferase family protein [Kineothrix sp. MB12-C1]